MGKAQKKPRKHIPQRTCVGCREIQGKKTMVRIVRTEEGVFLDLTGKRAGRGAYLHIQPDCITKGLNGAIARALKTEIQEDNLIQLKTQLSDQLTMLTEQNESTISSEQK